jgi:predicted DCC family thiol-disulfide oxidoreductase YuxK
VDSASFLYDGDCAFCSTCARLIRRWVPTTGVRIEAWQFVDLVSLGLTVEHCDAAVQWVSHRETASGPAAIARLLRASNLFWRTVGWLLGTRPALAAAGPVYRWVARNRHRLPGGTATCVLPAADRAKIGGAGL